MNLYRKKSDAVKAVQFNYIDGIDGPKTHKLAQSLGLSTHGTSVLWEIHTTFGWHIVDHRDWILTNTGGGPWCIVLHDEAFKATYEPLT